jgi:hypothetical protein
VIDEFAARRRVSQDSAINALRPAVQRWLRNIDSEHARAEVRELLSELYVQTYHGDGGTRLARTAAFLRSMERMMGETKSSSDAETVAAWLAVATLNAAGVQAAADEPWPMALVWTTMHDTHVRHAHAEADGQRRPPGSTFFVGGQNLRFPGDPRGRLDNTINCRCVLKPVRMKELTAAAKENPMLDKPLAWHGVLAPEDEWSGDGRRFAAGALRNRDLPLPLTWQRASGDGHDGSVVVARIDSIERVGNMMRGEGVFIATPEADEAVGLIAEFGKFGVSVDADDSEFEFDEESNKVTFTSARIASASLVSIPAFASAYVALGTWAEADGMLPPQDGEPTPDEEECDPESPDYEDCLAQKRAESGPEVVPAPPDKGYSVATTSGPGLVELISEQSWDGSAGRFTPEQWKRSTILHVCDGLEKSCHKLPIKEPGGQLSRAGVHAAASRLNQVDAPAEAKAKAKSSLRGAYKQLGEQPPDALKATAADEKFGRGPGWLTNPEDTRRIHDYWTVPGNAGYEKVQWGVPGDFNRCRVEVGEEIGEESPEKLRFINQICSQWHHDATGFWPGHAPAEVGSARPIGTYTAPAVNLVASADTVAPAAWFTDPKLPGPTHLTITKDGRVFGHLAQWGVCHIGFDGVCVTAPPSASAYAYFATGSVLLDSGETARTGVISLGGGHAAGRLGARPAAAHYDSTSAAVADVSVGEDDYGIWCAGWIRPGTDEKAVVALRASDISGDWRDVGGSKELVAALAVNVAGFPTVTVTDGVQLTLVAAGVVHEQDDMAERVARYVDVALQARDARRNKMAELRERVGANAV